MGPKPGKKTNNLGDDSPAIPPALPPSVEEAYRRKCLQLKRRTNEVEEDNEAARLRLARLKRGVEKLRLERAFLLDQLAKRTSTNVEDSEGSPSPPPTVRDEHEHGPAHSPSPAPTATATATASIATTSGPRSRQQKPLPSGFGSASAGAGTGTDQDLPLRQPQEKPLRSKRGHRKPSVVAALEPSGSAPTFIHQSAHNLSPSSDAFSHSVTAGDAASSSQHPKEAPAPRSNGVAGAGASSSKAPKKPSSAFELYCSENRAAALESKAEGVSVEEELARGWKDLSESQKDAYQASGKASHKDRERHSEKEQETEDRAGARADSAAEDTREEDVDMENED